MIPIDILFLISCIYVPILIALYLAEIWTILKPGSPFKGSFYILFVAGAITDLIMVIDTMHELRLVFYPLVNGLFVNYQCMTCTSVRLSISYMCPFAQDMINTFIALNRLTSIKLPVDHANIWRKLLPISIVLSYLIPIAIFAAAVMRKVTYLQIPMGPNWILIFALEDFETWAPWYATHRIMSIEMVISSIIIIILYTMAARSLGKLTTDSATKKQERKLLLFGIINFMIATPLMFLQIMLDLKFFSFDVVVIMVYQFSWLVDIKTFCAAVTMVVVNTTFRKHMLKSFGIAQQETSILVHSTSSNTHTASAT